jgi:hypothetical protein
MAKPGIIIWVPNPCPKWYNVYRAIMEAFIDDDNDGIQDAPFECFDPHNTTGTSTDPDTPPPGWLHAYFLTAVNDDGVEGSAGQTTGMIERRFIPCP